MSEVTSVNGKTGEVTVKAADVEAIPATEAGAANGVATLNSSTKLSEAQLPSAVVIGRTKALGEVSGVVKLPFGEGSTFTAKLTGATEFEPTELPTFRENGTLWVEPNGHTFSIKGISWIGSEPAFKTTGAYAISLFALGGALYGLAGLEGPEGQAGNTVRSGEGAPAEGLGVAGDYYINTAAHTIYGPKVGSSWGSATSLVGPEGSEGKKGATGPSSIESMIGACYSLMSGPTFRVATASQTFGTAKRGYFQLLIIPKEGKITKVWVRNGATLKGKTRVGIYDTGQKAIGEYALLAQSAEVTPEGTEAWQLIEVPEATYAAGQGIMVGIMNSTNEGTYGLGQGGLTASNQATLPEGSLGSGVKVAAPKMLAAHTFTAFEFVSLAVANLEATSTTPPLVLVHVE